MTSPVSVRRFCRSIAPWTAPILAGKAVGSSRRSPMDRPDARKAALVPRAGLGGYLTRGTAAALFGAALLSGMPANAAGRGARPAPPTAVRLELSPAEAVLQGRGERDRVFVTAILPDGSRRDVTRLAAFR